MPLVLHHMSTTWSHSLHFGTNFTTTTANNVQQQSHNRPMPYIICVTDEVFDFFQVPKHVSKSTDRIL